MSSTPAQRIDDVLRRGPVPLLKQSGYKTMVRRSTPGGRSRRTRMSMGWVLNWWVS